MRPNPDPIVSHVTHMMTELAASKRMTGVILAVSGGLDSLVLLHSLATRPAEWPFRFHVASFDHGWRTESAMDAVFVQEMALQLGLDCTIGRMTTLDKTPLGREAVARAARYNFLAQVAHAQGANTIVTAHHADDQIETILLHLLRGTGTHGLQGMIPYTHLPGDDTLWLMRPLLDIPRHELEAYATRHHLTPRHDVSNDDTRYQRNALRREIVPQLKRFNPKFTQNLIRLSSIVRDEQSYLDQELVRGLLHDTEKSTARWMIERHRFWEAHIALQKRYVWHACQTLSTTPQDVTYERIMAAVTMIRDKRVGAKIEIPGGVIVHLTQTHVMIEHKDAPPIEWIGPLLEEGQVIPVAVPGITTVGNGWFLQVTSVSDAEAADGLQIPVPPDTQVFLRTRHANDLFRRHDRRMLLNDLLKTRQVPLQIRARLPLLILDGNIAAVWFNRQGDQTIFQQENDPLYNFIWRNETS